MTNFTVPHDHSRLRMGVARTPHAHRRLNRFLLSCVLVSTATLTSAQGLVQPLPGAPSAVQPIDPAVAERQSAQQQLTAALARIAENGDDWQSLTQAGRAALVLGDPRAALGFLSRAEILAPRDPVIKAALGAALVRMEDATQAMRFFDSAIALGGLERAYLADRGLAFDLLGDQRRAQADYAAAAQFAPSAEVTRRYAISLGIAGQQDAAIQMLGPLLRAQDRAAWRSRAMIVAMSGRPDEARQIARATMPAQLAQGLDPYFSLMPRLTSVQLAAAAHFGRFPTYEMVAAQPVRNAGVQVAIAAAAPAAAPATRRGRAGRRAIASAGTTAPLQAPRPSPTAARRDAARAAIARTGASTPARATPPPVAVSAPTRAPGPAGQAALPPALPSQPAAVAVAQNVIPSPSLPTATPALDRAAALAATAPSVAAQPTPIPAAATPLPAPPVAVVPPPAANSAPTTIVAVALPPSQPAGVATNGAIAGPPGPDGRLPSAAPAVAAPSPSAPALVQPSVAAADTNVLTGWSLDDVAQSVTVPASERSVEAGALGIDELRAIATERRRAAAAAAAERRERERTDARARAEADAAATERAAEVAREREAAEARNRHPARAWVQIATGSDPAALAYDYRRMSRANASLYEGQAGATAVWNRTRRLVVGPFRTAAQARAWLARLSAAGGDGFVWTSDVGQEVTPIARR